MAPKPDKDFIQRYCAATKAARERANLTMKAIAEKLGISSRTYEKYEMARPLPHHLVAPFCLLTDTHISELFVAKAPRLHRSATARRSSRR